jgi:hypothetical protein
MKLRIKGNSVRIRLSVSEVRTLSSGAALTESTAFGDTQLVYAVKPVEGGSMKATFENSTISVLVPASYLLDWPSNSVVGFEETIGFDNGTSLHVLIEKDFKCLDASQEDQADFYENPAKSC